MTMADAALQREVLDLFAAHSADIVAALQQAPADPAALAHTLKGAARAVGAFAVADAAARLEAGADTDALALLSREVARARGAIAELLQRP